MKLDFNVKHDHQGVKDFIISQIRDLINLKNLEPGDKIPSERILSEKFNVSRSNVRDAIQKLEFYGILNSIPQSGTFVADIGVTAMNGMIDDILRLEEPDFRSLVETRVILELKIARLAAVRRTDADLIQIEEAMNAYNTKILNGEKAVQEDLLFHLAIAKACGNSTLNTLMLMITPDIITNFEKYHVCSENLAFNGMQEHKDIFDAIKAQDPDLAKKKIKTHFKTLYQYINSTK
jgi:GntR family transcriptional repressor for pyruvate dehydrogenase complex